MRDAGGHFAEVGKRLHLPDASLQFSHRSEIGEERQHSEVAIALIAQRNGRQSDDAAASVTDLLPL